MISPRKKSKTVPSSVDEAIRAWEVNTKVWVITNPPCERGQDSSNGAEDAHRERARIALHRLFAKQCDPVSVLSLLAFHYRKRLDLRALRSKVSNWQKRLKNLSRNLARDAHELEDLDKILQLEIDLPNQIGAFLHDFDRLRAVQNQMFSEGILSRGSGLQIYLALAVRLVERVSGTPHYPELTEISQALTGKELDESTIRKNVENFEQSADYAPKQFEVDLITIVAQNRRRWAALNSRASDPATRGLHISPEKGI